MTKKIKAKSKVIDNDQWLTAHFQEVVDKYAGGFIFVVNGKIVYTNKDGTPKELVKRIKVDSPDSIPLFFRVPYPHEFICALIIP